MQLHRLHLPELQDAISTEQNLVEQITEELNEKKQEIADLENRFKEQSQTILDLKYGNDHLVQDQPNYER